MRFVLALATIAVAAVVVQEFVPALDTYHAGWYNVAIAAEIAIAFEALRRARRKRLAAMRGTAIALAGAAVVALAGIAAGLLGPDTQSVIGAPGTAVAQRDLGGNIIFPLTPRPDGGFVVSLAREGRALPIGPRRRYLAAFVLRQKPRTVIAVSAADSRGGQLTITQPSGMAFLSPILLLQQQTRIANMLVASDSFAVPAARRLVKAVLFTPEQAAQLHARNVIAGQPAVLFAVSDQNDRPEAGGIALTTSGRQRLVDSLRLRPVVEQYPMVIVASEPYAPLVILGLAVFSFGVVLYEMLTGKRLFPGETVTDILASVLTREPHWSDLPANTPASLVRLLRRCLTKDPRARLRDIGSYRGLLGVNDSDG